MAKGSYYNKNLPPRFVEAWKRIEESGVGLISLPALAEISGSGKAEAGEIAENLFRHKLLERIERGKYCHHNFTNENATGCFLAENGAVGYGSALNYHGFTPRFPNAIIIQTTKQRSNANFRGTLYRFISVKPDKYSGVETIGYGGEKFRITTPEKTLVDCFDKPDLAGEYPDLIRALAASDCLQDKLIEAGKAVHNLAALKRMGYIAELSKAGKLVPFCQFVQECLTASYDLFDPSGPKTGKMDARWKLRMNISADDIRNLIEEFY